MRSNITLHLRYELHRNNNNEIERYIKIRQTTIKPIKLIFHIETHINVRKDINNILAEIVILKILISNLGDNIITVKKSDTKIEDKQTDNNIV